jgi:hypothetical protein
MKLIPKIAESEVAPGSIKIYAEKASLELAQAAVAKAGQLTVVNASTVVTVVTAAKELHKVIGQIESSRKAAKRQFLDANKAIDELADRISGPLEAHYKRLTKLLAVWHDAEQRRKAEEERQKREAEEAAAAEERRKAEELERQREALLKAQAEAKTREEMEQASMDLDFMDAEIPVEVGEELEAIEIPIMEAPRAPIEGARTSKKRRFILKDPVAAYNYDRRLVRWELSILTAQDIVRLLEEKGLEIRIPGIEIEEYTDVTTPSGKS